MNQNMNQIRARHVLAFANDPHVAISGKDGGEVIKKIPNAIINGGLLSALAYSLEREKSGKLRQEGWKCVFDGIAMHLASPEVGFIDESAGSADGLIEFLTAEGTSSDKLREVSAEAMAWLEFARRLVK